MSTIQIQVTDAQFQTLMEMARAAGTTPEQIVQTAFERVIADAEQDEQQKLAAWKAAALKIAGIWEGRTDFPDFTELRKSWDRGYADRE